MLKIDVYWDLRSTNPDRHTGVGRHVIEVLSRLDMDPEVDVRVLLATDQSSFWSDQAEAYGWGEIQTVTLAFSNKMLRLFHGFSSIGSLERVCESRDLVYSPMEMVVHTGKVPFINTIHGIPCFEATLPQAVYNSMSYRFERFKQAWFLRRCRQICRRSFVVSNYLKQQLEARFAFNDTQLHIVNNGAMDLFFTSSDRADNLSVSDRTTPAPIRFLSVGGVNAFDGGEHLVQLAALIHEVYPAASIRIVGDRHEEPWHSQLKAMPQVEWLGFLEAPDLYQEMQNSTALLYLPDVESFGIIGVEAMAAGLPILARSTTALPEVLGDAAYWIDLADEPAVRAALQAVATDAFVREALIAKGQAQAACFRWHVVVESVLRGFHSALK